MGVFLCSSNKKELLHHPSELLLKCMIQFLQVHQGAGLGAAIHNVLILDTQQVALGDHDIDVPHQVGDTIQVQTVFQLHLCEGMATGMRADTHRGRDSSPAPIGPSHFNLAAAAQLCISEIINLYRIFV